MDTIQSQFVEKMLADRKSLQKGEGSAFAPSNIALCKYWGKRDAELNLPINSSLSISLAELGTHTQIRLREGRDAVYLNDMRQAAESGFIRRMSAFLDLFRSYYSQSFFEVRTNNNIPTAAGLASSASGFAALVLALNDLGGWGLNQKHLSMLARLGSGSASRSVYEGFVQWNAGLQSDGSDSFAERLEIDWPELRVGVLEVSADQKPVGSRDGMNRTVATSELYNNWPNQARADLAEIRSAIEQYDFSLLGKTAERNALAMHATMLSAWPPLLYLQPESVEQIHNVQRARADGLEVYLTIDAGPNIKLLFLAESERDVCDVFPGVRVIRPFLDL
ncbi:MAG: diphosphomevalonate decarboxylase [Pontiellaceae bacterium]|nr:diphosphomevalonate decarboxylase [Pontiellaceae bacterium]